MSQKIIRLTESDLHRMIMESVNNIIAENYDEALPMDQQLMYIENMTRALRENPIDNKAIQMQGDTMSSYGSIEFDVEDAANQTTYYVKANLKGRQTYPGRKSFDYYQPDDDPEYEHKIESLEITVEDEMNQNSVEMTLSADANMPAEVEALFSMIEDQLEPEYDIEAYNPY